MPHVLRLSYLWNTPFFEQWTHPFEQWTHRCPLSFATEGKSIERMSDCEAYTELRPRRPAFLSSPRTFSSKRLSMSSEALQRCSASSLSSRGAAVGASSFEDVKDASASGNFLIDDLVKLLPVLGPFLSRRGLIFLGKNETATFSQGFQRRRRREAVLLKCPGVRGKRKRGKTQRAFSASKSQSVLLDFKP